MNRFKKMLSMVLAGVLVCLLGSGVARVAAVEYILDPAQAKGSDYTRSEAMAQVLDRIFSGDVDVFSDAPCTAEVSMPLGTKMSNSTQYYVKSKTTGNKISGWQCYIYANGVYNQLFGEWVGHANGYAHSHTVISGGGNDLSYELLSNAGIRCGAYLRTTGNSDGSYSSNVGHSMILLSYDEENITYLEGNADGNGLIRITTRDWSDFNQRQLSGRSRYIAHIAQPKDEVYEELYPVCLHEAYGKLGVCSGCGEAFDWESTFSAADAGQYKVIQTVSAAAEVPYKAASSQVLKIGMVLEITGKCQNAFGEIWYEYVGEDEKKYYVPQYGLLFSEPLPLRVSCIDFSPADQTVLQRKAQPVKGTVMSNYPIKKIFAYLDGKLYATWIASEERLAVDLRATDVNHMLSFSTLEKGRHTIMLKVQTIRYEEPVTIHESVFYMEALTACQHSYQSQTVQAPTCETAGVQIDVCSHCGDQKTQMLPALGHEYAQGICSRCGVAEEAGLTGTVTCFFGEELPMVVTLRKGSEIKAQSTISGLSGVYTFQGLEPGSYTLEIHKEGGVTQVAAVKLESGTVSYDARICQLGDVSGDGRINVGDTARLYAHIRNTDPIKELYVLQCSDLSEDGTVNIGDVGKLYAIVKAK